ncbi:hypothetical protein HRED_06952 [Candidatus Haloredivivus sp. G17]|nr:hypothetical protein HRED_06952 [Candidatus Haloredivivus sp. G17]
MSGSTVEFWVDDGLEVYQVNTDTVSGSSGTASISLQDFEFRNEPADGTGDWFVKVNDTYSETDYSRSKYGSNTYNFSAAKPPLILSEDPSSYPIAETGVGLNPDLSIAVNDPALEGNCSQLLLFSKLSFSGTRYT